jgi:molecular chaperone GrpE
MRDLLPVIDNLERAIEHFQAGSDQVGLIEGLNMTHKGFLDSLGRFGCNQVEAVDEAFDPNLHEAVSQEESDRHKANTVLRELQKGYMLKERLLRPAMVVVSKPPSQVENDSENQEEGKNRKTEEGIVRIEVKKA